MTRHKTSGGRAGAWAIAGVTAVVVAGVGFAYVTTLSGRTGSSADDPEQIALGKRVYVEACASCHGDKLEGQPNWRVRQANGRLPAPPHDETGHTWHHPDQQLFEMTKLGVEVFAPDGYESDMPAFADTLTDDEIWAVIAFIKSTWPSENRTRQADITRRYSAE